MPPATKICRLVICALAAIDTSGCRSSPAAREMVAVTMLRSRAAACARFADMDVATQSDAMFRLRGEDSYRCDRLRKEAVHMRSDPATNPSGDPRTMRLLESLAFPQG
jgi:hypothetical protein